jgi:hypothetical protein
MEFLGSKELEMILNSLGTKRRHRTVHDQVVANNRTNQTRAGVQWLFAALAVADSAETAGNLHLDIPERESLTTGHGSRLAVQTKGRNQRQFKKSKNGHLSRRGPCSNPLAL